MSVRQHLHKLVDMVDETSLNTLYNVVSRFVPEDEILPDEIESIKQAREEFARGEYLTHEEVWGKRG